MPLSYPLPAHPSSTRRPAPSAGPVDCFSPATPPRQGLGEARRFGWAVRGARCPPTLIPNCCLRFSDPGKSLGFGRPRPPPPAADSQDKREEVRGWGGGRPKPPCAESSVREGRESSRKRAEKWEHGIKSNQILPLASLPARSLSLSCSPSPSHCFSISFSLPLSVSFCLCLFLTVSNFLLL